MRKEYTGWILLRPVYHNESQSDDVIRLARVGELDGPLVETLAHDAALYGNFVNIAYYVADRELDLADLQEGFVRSVLGAAESGLRISYSDTSGVWATNEFLKVGGHDLLAELQTYAGRYLHLTIEYRKSPKEPRSKVKAVAAPSIPSDLDAIASETYADLTPPFAHEFVKYTDSWIVTDARGRLVANAGGIGNDQDRYSRNLAILLAALLNGGIQKHERPTDEK